MPLQGTNTPSAPSAPAGGTTAGTTPAPQAVTTSSPSEWYTALREQRRVLGGQMERLEDKRGELTRALRSGTASDGDRAGLESRLAQTDQQIATLGITIAQVDAQVAAAAAVPGAVLPDPPDNPWQYGPPEELVFFGLFLTALLLAPIALAYARRMWRKSAVTVTLAPELSERILAMERSMDAVAVEVERVGEGQRFVTQLLAERAKGVTPALAQGSDDRHV